MNYTKLASACLVGGLCLSPLVIQAAKPVAAPSVAENADLSRVLRSELVGQADRRAALAELLQSRTDITSARWQAGFVRDGDGWRSFDEAASSNVAQEKLEQYRARRQAAPATRAGQLQLADWCREHALPDQERAHLNAVLALNSEDSDAPVLERLGYRRLGGRWLSREQLVEWRESNRQAEASMKRFGSKMERIAKQVSGAKRQREAGLVALKEIKDPAAIPAMELTLAGRNEAAALALVETLAALDGYEAAIALARQGVFSNWRSVRESAATALKSRNLEHFVPQLVGLLSTPIKGEVNTRQFGWRLFGNAPGTRWRMQSGVLEYAYIMKRETGDQFQVATFNTVNSMIDDYLEGRRRAPPSERSRTTELNFDNVLFDTALARGKTDAIREFQDDVHRKEQEVARQNGLISEMNQRVGTVLATVSGQTPTAQPQPWWTWWNQLNDVGSDKQVVRIVDENQTVGSVAPVFAWECFAAGTPVWTDSGPVAIEELRVGDRVLAKNIETGELAYKPVLETTLRPAKELQTLRLGDESIVCTGGHRFWISGTGWVKARDLAPASLVHTATGNTPVWSAKEGQTAETYNLVVADFHTYFVGKSGVLCQDVMLPRPTNKVVPGLDRAQVAAAGK